MKTQPTITKEKKKNSIHQLFEKWITRYINSMTKLLYPDTDTPDSNNDKNRIFYK